MPRLLLLRGRGGALALTQRLVAVPGLANQPAHSWRVHEPVGARRGVQRARAAALVGRAVDEAFRTVVSHVDRLCARAVVVIVSVMMIIR